MATIPQPWLFNWKEIDAASELDRLALVFSVLPDEKLVSLLEQKRGKGRDDYPIRPMWNALLAGVVFQHKNAAELLRELRRNGELRQVCGFDPFGRKSSSGSVTSSTCSWIRRMNCPSLSRSMSRHRHAYAVEEQEIRKPVSRPIRRFLLRRIGQALLLLSVRKERRGRA